MPVRSVRAQAVTPQSVSMWDWPSGWNLCHAGRCDAQRVHRPVGRACRGGERTRARAHQRQRGAPACSASAGYGGVSRDRLAGESPLVGRRWEMAASKAFLIGRSRAMERSWLWWGRRDRQEPYGARNCGDRGQARRGGLLGLLRVSCQRHPLPCGDAARARASAYRHSTRSRCGSGCGNGLWTPTNRTWCYSRICSGSATLISPCHTSIPMRGVGDIRIDQVSGRRTGNTRDLHCGGCALDRRGQRFDAGRLPFGGSADRSMVLVTYRPDFCGAFTRVPGHRRLRLRR